MNNCSAYESIKEKRKEEINLSQSSLQDSKLDKEEHLFSMQLISQEKNLATEINHFEGSGPEWLVPKAIPFFVFWQRAGFLRGRKGNNILVYACGTNSLFFSFFFFCFFSYLPFFFFLSCYSLFLFLGFQVLNLILFLTVILLLLYTTRASFYSACRDWNLPF